MAPNKKITERTLYAPLWNYARSLGFDAVQELSWDEERKTLDLLVMFGETKYVLEIKVGARKERYKIMIDGLVQAFHYAKKEKTNNIAVIIYDENFRKEPIHSGYDVDSISLESNVDYAVFSDYWYEYGEITGRNFFDKIWNCVNEKPEIEKKVEVAAELLATQVKELSRILRKHYAKPSDIERLAKDIGHTYNAFFSISNMKISQQNKKEINLAIVDLLSCVVVCQIIFYMVYRKRINMDLPRLPDSANNVMEIQNCLSEIRKIDYEAIYEIKALMALPPTNEEILKLLCNTISLLDGLRPDEIEHDLLGQLFNSIMPQNTQKVLAAFYSLKSASDILARLSIRDYNKKVWDPACGSGTILISAYRAMRDHYKNRVGASNQDMKQMHKEFIEKQITGNDIMAFACILSGLNLATQDLSVQTNTVRIFNTNSLELPNILKRNGSVKSATKFVSETISSQQRTLKNLEEFDDEYEYKNEPNCLEINGDGPEFTIEKVDVVLMNPPFTVRTNLDADTISELKSYPFASKRCGHDVDFWGYFLAIAPDLIREGGTIGAIVSSGFLRGKHTQKIRDYYINELSIKYLILPTGNRKFSANSDFKDIILICENKKPTINDKTSIVLLGSNLNDMELNNSKLLVKDIERLAMSGGGSMEGIEVKIINQDLLSSHRENLMPLFTPTDIEKSIDEIMNNIFDNKKLEKMGETKIKYGIYLDKNYSKAMYILRNLPSRTLHQRLMKFDGVCEGGEQYEVRIERGKFKGQKSIVKQDRFIRGLISPSGIATMDVSNSYDLIASEPFDLIDTIGNEYGIMVSKTALLKQIGPMCNKSNVALAARFNLSGKNSHHLAFFSNEPFHIHNSMYRVETNSIDEAKILCVSLNSCLSYIQIGLLKNESQMDWSNLGKEDWKNTFQINYERLSESERVSLIKLYDELSAEIFPTIQKQFINEDNKRIKLDREILKILGYSDNKIDKILPALYYAILSKLNLMGDSA